METTRPFDIQSIGRQLAWLRKENKRLTDLVTELSIKNDGLKLTIEQILLTPSNHPDTNEM